MKFGRVLLVGIAVLAILLLAAVGIVCTSGFQTWATRRALAGQTEMAVSVGRVSAGWQRVRLENIRVERAGTVLTLPTAEIGLPVASAALRQTVSVRRLEASGWTLDLTHAPLPAPIVTATGAEPGRNSSLVSSAMATALPPVVFSGIFNQLKLPVDLALDGVNLAGEVILPALPGRPADHVKVTLTGGGLASGHPGKFEYTATIRFEGDGAVVHELRVRGTLGVVMNTPRTFSRFVAATTAEAEGPTFPGGVKLAVDVTAAQSAVGENYAMAVLSGTKQLAAVETSYTAGQSHLRGTWRLDMHDADVAPFMLGRELPVFEAAGEGRFDLDTSLVELIASGRLNATADRLRVINAQLSGVGSVHVVAEFDFAQRGTTTRVDRLAVTVEGAKPFVTVKALQPFEFNLTKGEGGMPVVTELNVADPASELLGVVFQGLPVSWVSPWVRKAGFAVTGGELRGELAASARNGGFTLRAKSPLTVGNVSIAQNDGRQLLREVDVTLTPSADYTPQGWQVAFAPLSLGRNGSPVLALEVKAGQLAGKNQPIKLAGDWTVQLPALLSQVGSAGPAILTGGEAQGEFAASLGTKREIQVRLGLANLVAAAGGGLPKMTADLRADVDTDGKITFNAPVLVEREGRKSDVTLAGTLTSANGVRVVSGRLTSDLLVIDDVKAFSAPLAGTDDAAPTVGRKSSAISRMPFWSGFTGQCALTLKNVVYSGEFHVTDAIGVLRLEPAALTLTDVKAGFGRDSTVRFNGDLTFNAKGSLPYGVAADLAVDNFDLGAIFRARDPSRPPTVEGRVYLQTHLTGNAPTLDLLAERTQGDLRVTGKSGVFRALSADMSDRIQKTQSRVAAIGSLLGVVTDDYVNKTQILADIAKALSEIPYDQLSMTAVRDASLNLVVKDFTLISPEVRLGGNGIIRYAAGVPIAAQPMELQLNLGTRGRLGDLMKRAGLLEAQQDALGYAAFAVPLKVGGTLTKPDASAIRDALLNSALQRSGLLDNLFNRVK